MLTVSDVMTTAVLAFKAIDSVEDAHQRMLEAEIRHIPVIDDHQHLIGIVSDRDVFLAPRTHGKNAPRLSDVMTREVVSVSPETPAHVAAQYLLDNKIGALPVVDEEQVLIGIITETDFIRVARRALRPGRAAARS